MAQLSQVGKLATTIRAEGDSTVVRYHSTDVVSFNARQVRLMTDGYLTSTTKARMNQASNQFKLGYRVFQKRYRWYVSTPSGATLEFSDGVVFSR